MTGGGSDERERRKDESDSGQNGKIIDIRNYKPKRRPQLIWRECTPRPFLSGYIKKVRSLRLSGRLINLRGPSAPGRSLYFLDVYEERNNQRGPSVAAPEYNQSRQYPYKDGGVCELKYDEPVFDSEESREVEEGSVRRL
mgnify:CR=1 FL=1